MARWAPALAGWFLVLPLHAAVLMEPVGGIGVSSGTISRLPTMEFIGEGSLSPKAMERLIGAGGGSEGRQVLDLQSVANHVLKLIAQGKTIQALDLASFIAADAPRSAGAQKLLGHVYFLLGQHDKANLQLAKAREQNPDDFSIWALQGLVDADAGRWEAAWKSFRRAIELRPDDASCLHNAGILLHRMGRDAEAVKLLERSVRQDPRSAANWSDLGMVLLALERPEEAEYAFLEALTLDASHVDAYAHLANLYISAHKPRLAVEAVARGVEATRGDPVWWDYLKTALMRALEADPAKLDPAADPEALYRDGLAAVQEGRTRDGMILLLEAFTRRPDSAGVANDLGVLLVADGQAEAARVILLRAAAPAPSAGPAPANIQYVERAVAERRRLVAESHQLAGRLIQAPQDVPALLERGRIQRQLGLPDDAGALFQRALRQEPRNVAVRTELASLWAAQGRLFQAADQYRAALAIEPDNPDLLLALATLLMNSMPDEKTRGEALALAQRANGVTRGQSPYCLQLLSAAQALDGRFAEAEANARRGSALAELHGLAELAQTLQIDERQYHALALQTNAPTAAPVNSAE